MDRIDLNAADHQLVKQAAQLIENRQNDQHAVATVVRTKNGRFFPGLHLETYVGRAAICAEAIALGTAVTAGESTVETLVSVNRNQKIVSPCGICRELITDYAPEALIILEDQSGIFKVRASQLLPEKYQR